MTICVFSEANAKSDPEKYGLFGERITDTSDGSDGKISVLKFNVSDLKKNLKNLDKAELELTLINRRSNSSTGTDRLMVVPVSGEWDAKKATWNTHPEWDTEKAVYSEEFQVDKNSEVKNNVAITDSNYDGTKAIVDVTELIKIWMMPKIHFLWLYVMRMAMNWHLQVPKAQQNWMQRRKRLLSSVQL